MLHPKIAQALIDTQKRLYDTGELPSPEKLQGYYNLFRERFGPEVLKNLDGEALLTKMHQSGNNSLVYWLEFKRDEEFPYIFGSIAGGSALKFGVYQSQTGAWMSRDSSNYAAEIPIDQAISIAQRHRDQLLRGVDLLENLPTQASAADYRKLQQDMDEQAPDVSNLAWGHKYFSLLYPDKLDDFHAAYYQRFHLVKLLQSNIPEESAGRYIAAGQFVALANELHMPMNYFSAAMKHIHGRPYRYWSIFATDPREADNLTWEMQRDGGFAAITWSALPNLSDIKYDSPSKKVLRDYLKHAYPRFSNSELQGIFDFVATMQVGDVVAAFDPETRQIVGIGKVRGNYYHAASQNPHRRAVDWYSVTPWQFSVEKGFERGTREILTYTNKVEIESQFLEASLIPRPLLSEAPIVSPEVENEAIAPDEVKADPKIFISYRRKSWPFTHHLADRLAKRLAAEIFVDYTGIDEADFEHSILKHLQESDAVILIISEHTFEDRIHNDVDWVRREIREALTYKKPLILVCVEGRLPPHNLPNDIVDVNRMQGINFYPEYFNAGIIKLAKFVAKIVGNADILKSPKLDDISVSKIDRSTLNQVFDSMNQGNFHQAITFLKGLQRSGYQSRYVNLDDILKEAEAEAKKIDALEQAKLDYRDIVMMSSYKLTQERAHTAFIAWCKDHAALVDQLDTENLRQRFNPSGQQP